MPNEILDNSSTSELVVRSTLLNFVEILLLFTYTIFLLYICLGFDSNLTIGYPIVVLIILLNLKFIYSCRKAFLEYQQTQEIKNIRKIKDGISRLVFICTGICISLIGIAIISYNLPLLLASSQSLSLNSLILFIWTLVVAAVPSMQIYYMSKTANIFHFITNQ